MQRVLAVLAAVAALAPSVGTAAAAEPPAPTDTAGDVVAAPLTATRVDQGAAGASAGDPLRARQWHLTQAGATTAGADGVTVAVLDTGISPDGEDLTCHRFVAPYDARSGRTGMAAVADRNGHGTHIAGTVAQCTGNGVGVAGVAPGARLMPVKVLDDDGAGSYADVAAGIDWARSNGADVITMSLGGGCQAPWPQCRSAVVDEAIARAVAADIVLVAAAGNDASPFLDYPAAHPDVVAVGATMLGGQAAAYSNRGSRLDLVAPGGVSAGDADGDGYPDGVIQETFRHGVWGYWSWAGTSFATPHVAGAAAVLRAAAPDASASDVAAALRCAAADGGHPGPDEAYGHGELRVAAALSAVTSGVSDSDPPHWRGAGVQAAALSADRIELRWDEPWECSAVAGYRVYVDGALHATVDPGSRRLTVGGRAAATTYSFRVEAGDIGGNWSAAGPVTAARTLGPGDAVELAAGPAIGLVDPATGVWHVRAGSGAAVTFYYGDPGDHPFMGDWDCDGEATPGLYRRSDGFVYLRNSTTQGRADLEFYFGDPGDVPLAGDFDGDGCDTVSLYRPSEARVYVIDRLGDARRGLGRAAYSYPLGDPGDVPFVGDFDGDGTDEVGVHRPATGWVYVPTGGHMDAYPLAARGDIVLAGDFDGDGTATLAVRRPATATFLFIDGADPVVWGDADWRPVAPR